MDDDPLLRSGLRPVELTDQPRIAPFFDSLDHPLSDYTFSQLFTWRNSLRIIWTELHGHLCVFANGSGDLTLLMPPIGEGNADKALMAAFELMDDYNADHGVPDHSRVEYASEELLARLGAKAYCATPMGADYVYDVNRMIDLAGGDLASKRQAKNRFQRNYAYRVENYDADRHLQPCRRLLDHWKIFQDATHLEESNLSSIKRQKESIATELTLASAAQLNMLGLVVYVRDPAAPWPEDADPDGFAIRGFTFGEFLGRDQSSITIEKTDLAVKGLAQFIFSEFCRLHWQQRPLVNAGDDWGLESLAWTKNSYRPVKILRKFSLKKPDVVMTLVPIDLSSVGLSSPRPTAKRSPKEVSPRNALDRATPPAKSRSNPLNPVV